MEFPDSFPDFNLRKFVIETSRCKFITIIEWFLVGKNYYDKMC